MQVCFSQELKELPFLFQLPCNLSLTIFLLEDHHIVFLWEDWSNVFYSVDIMSKPRLVLATDAKDMAWARANASTLCCVHFSYSWISSAIFTVLALPVLSKSQKV